MASDNTDRRGLGIPTLDIMFRFLGWNIDVASETCEYDMKVTDTKNVSFQNEHYQTTCKTARAPAKYIKSFKLQQNYYLMYEK